MNQPIGVEPRSIWISKRIDHLLATAAEYCLWMQSLNPEDGSWTIAKNLVNGWISEAEELHQELENSRNGKSS